MTETTQNPNQSVLPNQKDWRNRKIVEEEQLIEEIHKRPALWNFKLPLIERSLQIKKSCGKKYMHRWTVNIYNFHIHNLAGIKFIVLLNIFIFSRYNGHCYYEKKWKSLCDSFRIHRNKQHQPSGSAGTRKNTWIHFERMQFLCDV